MKILTFTDETKSNTDFAELNNNVGFSGETLYLTEKYKHTTLDKWWFSRDDCEDTNNCNGHLSTITTLINGHISAGDCIEEEKTHQELIDEGYLPQPEPI